MKYAYFIDNTNRPEPVDNCNIFQYINDNSILEDLVVTDVYGNRNEIQRLFGNLREQDVLVVRSIQDLGDTITEILRVLFWLSTHKVELISLSERYYKTKDYERIICDLHTCDLILKEDSRNTGYQKALSERRVGRPKKSATKKALQLYEKGTFTVNQISKLTGVSSSTLYRALKDTKI